jgi:hypothetical protein
MLFFFEKNDGFGAVLILAVQTITLLSFALLAPS